MCGAEKQYLKEGIIAVVFDNLVSYILSAAPETAHLDILRTVQQMPQKKPAYCPCEIFKPGKLPLFKHSEHNIIALFHFVKELWDL